MFTPLKIRFSVTLFTVFIFGCYHHSDGVQELEATRFGGIKDLVDEYIAKLRADIPEPISVTNYSLELTENDFITGNLNMSDVKLSGIKGFGYNVKYILGQPNSYFISFDYIDLNLKYVSDLQVLSQPLLSIFGDGHALIALTNLTIGGKMHLSIADFNLTITSMDINLSAAKFLFVGLLNDDDFSASVTDYLNNNFARLFNENSDVISGIVKDTINDLISSIINGNSTSTIGLEYKHDSDDYDSVNVNFNTEIVKIFLQKMVQYFGSIFV